MAPRSPVLVDTSVWVDYLRRGRSKEAQRLEELLQEDSICSTQVIRAKLLSGTPNQSAYDQLSDRFSVIPLLQEPADYWDRVAHARFRLARKGIQASLVDVSIAVLARYHRCALFSLDKDFRLMARILPLSFLGA